MSVLARWVIGPRLMGVPGVAHVAIWGNRDRQLQVQVDPEQLRTQGVTLQQVVETTGNALWVSTLSFLEASTPGAGGFIDTPNQRLGVWHVLPIKSPEDLAQVPLKGTAWRLGDVANVVEDHQPLIGDALVNDSPNLLLIFVAIPLSLLAALFVLYLRGATLNTLVLAGLVVALGAIIDDAIIDVERIRQRLRQNRRAGSPRSAESVILEASAEVRGTFFFATLITLLAVLPVFFMEGLSGALFRPLAISYALAVLAAMAVALTATPAKARHLGRRSSCAEHANGLRRS